MEEITVYKHVLEGVRNDLARAKMLLCDMGEWVGEVMAGIDDLEEQMENIDPAPVLDLSLEPEKQWVILNRARSILELLVENLESNELLLERSSRGVPGRIVKRGTPHAIDPQAVNPADFEGISDEELNQELIQQGEVMGKARQESELIIQVMKSRASQAAQPDEGGNRRQRGAQAPA
ncbi:hypothetical protein GMST_32730 [Geomonas silvestris]|uniref:Uncharacterized protein n=1 Tax=Geomonas silvestris TaxID=2740184 RepID=A0A6V8MLR6_9BACT|nr:hypothetical protein [Geomonas silvestris]GFO60948.1 hypothetical protein GMST_32730 [Geomonas silvestris]